VDTYESVTEEITKLEQDGLHDCQASMSGVYCSFKTEC